MNAYSQTITGLRDYELLRRQYDRMRAGGMDVNRIAEILGPDKMSLLDQHYSPASMSMPLFGTATPASAASAATANVAPAATATAATAAAPKKLPVFKDPSTVPVGRKHSLASATKGTPKYVSSKDFKKAVKTAPISKTTGSAAGAGAGATGAAGNAAKTAASKGVFKKDGWVGTHIGKFGDLSNPQFDWDPNHGVTGWGKNLGTLWNLGELAVQGTRAIKGVQDNSEARDSIDDIASDILLSANNSPTIWQDLNADQRNLLRQLQRGTYESEGDLGDVDGWGVVGDTLMGALSGAPGGIWGAVLGGLGGAANSIIGDYGDATSRDAAELEALYQAVLESEQYHNQMRKQRAYSALY